MDKSVEEDDDEPSLNTTNANETTENGTTELNTTNESSVPDEEPAKSPGKSFIEFP